MASPSSHGFGFGLVFGSRFETPFSHPKSIANAGHEMRRCHASFHWVRGIATRENGPKCVNPGQSIRSFTNG
jgi:hypothetical protein